MTKIPNEASLGERIRVLERYCECCTELEKKPQISSKSSRNYHEGAFGEVDRLFMLAGYEEGWFEGCGDSEAQTRYSDEFVRFASRKLAAEVRALASGELSRSILLQHGLNLETSPAFWGAEGEELWDTLRRPAGEYLHKRLKEAHVYIGDILISAARFMLTSDTFTEDGVKPFTDFLDATELEEFCIYGRSEDNRGERIVYNMGRWSHRRENWPSDASSERHESNVRDFRGIIVPELEYAHRMLKYTDKDFFGIKSGGIDHLFAAGFVTYEDVNLINRAARTGHLPFAMSMEVLAAAYHSGNVAIPVHVPVAAHRPVMMPM